MNANERLLKAAKDGDADGVAASLGEGANVNAVDVSKWTALHWACAEKQASLVTILITARADVCAADRNRNTPLHQACRGGCAAIVDLLLRAGANVEATDGRGRTPRDRAAQYKHQKCLDVIERLEGMLIKWAGGGASPHPILEGGINLDLLAYFIFNCSEQQGAPQGRLERQRRRREGCP